jgi:UDP-sulfoquinovose synthase
MPPIKLYIGDIAHNYRFLISTLEDFMPDTVIHYAEQPSAPYSMIDHRRAVDTQVNNVAGTLNLMFAIRKVVPDAHIIKLGTMGEYGTPNIVIEEGWLDIEHKGRKERTLFPKKPGSFYHLSKVHDSHNLEFGCRIWGMRVTDLNQGVVYGVKTEESKPTDESKTSFHYDSIFGTVLNRFVAQAASNFPLTVYGQGEQTRGYLNIVDTLQCVFIAAATPADEGEFRVFNQFTETFSVNQLAEKVARVGNSLGFDTKIQQIENPRIEMEKHFYEPIHSNLLNLGLKPTLLTDEIVSEMFELVQSHKESINGGVLTPTVKWKSN